MDDVFTRNVKLTENIIEAAVKAENMPSPSVISLEFIKNFARNFRMTGGMDGRAQEFILN